MPRMCVLCYVDMNAASLMLPVAQAGLIAAPVIFRREIVRSVDRVRGIEPYTAEGEDDLEGGDEPEAASE